MRIKRSEHEEAARKIDFRFVFLRDWLKNYSIEILIFVVASIVRLYHITYPIYDWMSFRQTQTVSTILNYYRNGIDLLHPTVNSIGSTGILVLEFPLFQAISALIYKLFAPDIIYIRFFSIICCLVTALYLYKLVRYLFNKEAAIFSIIFFLFAPLNIFFSRTPMIESFVAMLSIIFLYYFILWIDQRKTYMLFIGVIVASLAIIVKPPYSLIMFPVIVYYAFFKAGLKVFKDKLFLLGVFIPLITMILWQMHANFTNNAFNSLTDYPYQQLHGAFEVKLDQLNTWYFGTMSQRFDILTYAVIGKRIYYEILTILGVILVLISIPLKDRKHGILFEVWLATTILSFIVLLNLNYVHDYYQLPIVSILSIYCGIGFNILWQKIKSINIIKDYKNKVLVIILLFYLFNVAFVMKSAGYYQQPYPGYYDFGKQIQTSLSNNNDMVAISTVSEDLWNPVILYFADKKGYMLPQSQLNQEMIDYFREKKVVWLIITNYEQYKKKYNTNIMENYPVLENANPDMVIYRIDGQDIN